MLFSNKTHRTMAPREAATAHTRGELVLVDVRECAERDVDHVAGSLHIPLAQVPRRLGELPRDATVAFVCRSGRRSAAASAIAARAGVNAANVRGGMLAWRAAQLPVTTAASGASSNPGDAA